MDLRPNSSFWNGSNFEINSRQFKAYHTNWKDYAPEWLISSTASTEVGHTLSSYRHFGPRSRTPALLCGSPETAETKFFSTLLVPGFARWIIQVGTPLIPSVWSTTFSERSLLLSANGGGFGTENEIRVEEVNTEIQHSTASGMIYTGKHLKCDNCVSQWEMINHSSEQVPNYCWTYGDTFPPTDTLNPLHGNNINWFR